MHIYKLTIPEVIFGRGSLQQAGDNLRRLGARRVLVVSDPGVEQAGWTDATIQSVKAAGLEYVRWSAITPNPKDYEIVSGLNQYRDHECNAILGVGGGSVIDAAKAIALLVSNEGEIADFEGVDKIHYPLPPMVMVPTTAGSGSEVSQFAVITNSQQKKKMTIVSKSLVPDIAIIDPDTLHTLDSHLTAMTGIDVLCHAIESYLSLAATPLTEIHSLQAIQLVAGHLLPSAASSFNAPAKEGMALASLHAGIAFSNAILSAVHAISHQIGGLLDSCHAEINAVLLPHVLEFNYIAAPAKYARIAEALGEPVAGLSTAQAARMAIESIRRILRDLGVPPSLAAFGIAEEMIPVIGRQSLQDVCMVTNPRDLSMADVIQLIHKSMQEG